eukprot:CAMPEP_0114142652 /NCGR_PEP_ID=MMETSP0043_2-20121206/18559_1 /TAXON_ID=464988 /ORGANISM="Hemiselmis andersenii, Strain CCMP644" /LENGTH=274 /DNA_ID=CAMNT_0001236881 /DNA_START=41 /DNA_END=862 /DNA_ORIENTATION=+
MELADFLRSDPPEEEQPAAGNSGATPAQWELPGSSPATSSPAHAVNVKPAPPVYYSRPGFVPPPSLVAASEAEVARSLGEGWEVIESVYVDLRDMVPCQWEKLFWVRADRLGLCEPRGGLIKDCSQDSKVAELVTNFDRAMLEDGEVSDFNRMFLWSGPHTGGGPILAGKVFREHLYEPCAVHVFETFSTDLVVTGVQERKFGPSEGYSYGFAQAWDAGSEGKAQAPRRIMVLADNARRAVTNTLEEWEEDGDEGCTPDIRFLPFCRDGERDDV